MPKPEWLVRRESEVRRAFKHCVTCEHKGAQCGLTNNLGKGRGRLPMYECSLHPTVRFYEDTYACEDYQAIR